MARQDTRLESEGAEFLVLGQLLMHRIPSYKTYTNMPGYDLVATNPDERSSARIQVKSRWRTGAPGFLIKNFDCEFVVAVRLNRGSKAKESKILPPEYFVFPVEVVKAVHRTSDWGKAYFRDIEDLESYRDNWQLIASHLGLQTETGPASNTSKVARKLVLDRFQVVKRKKWVALNALPSLDTSGFKTKRIGKLLPENTCLFTIGSTELGVAISLNKKIRKIITKAGATVVEGSSTRGDGKEKPEYVGFSLDEVPASSAKSIVSQVEAEVRRASNDAT